MSLSVETDEAGEGEVGGNDDEKSWREIKTREFHEQIIKSKFYCFSKIIDSVSHLINFIKLK